MTDPTQLYLSRVRLRARRGEALAAVAPLLIPDNLQDRAGRAHRVMWLLFGDDPEAERDFLWRDEGNGRYMLLSRRPPADPQGLFDLESKPFEPHLDSGDRLRFALRANPVRAVKTARKGKADRGKRVDVVMHALHGIERTNWQARTGRAFERDRIVAEAGRAWLESQGSRYGFRLIEDPKITSYMQVPIQRRHGRPAGFSQIDTAGLIEIIEPELFLKKMAQGFGAAKAFGCGLMLIRRA